MSEDRYRVLQDAITKARDNQFPQPGIWTERNAHLDTLAAILDLHKPVDKTDCVACAGGMGEMADWPCPTVDEVETALRNMGALE